MSQVFLEYVDHFIPDVSKRRWLDEVVSDADILTVAEDIFEWEDKLVGPLELTQQEISDIHEESGNRPKLKR